MKSINYNYAYIAIVAIVAIVAMVVLLSGGSKTKTIGSNDLAGNAFARGNNFVSKGEINYVPGCECTFNGYDWYPCSYYGKICEQCCKLQFGDDAQFRIND